MSETIRPNDPGAFWVTDDIATLLRNLPTSGKDDYVMRVIEVYQRVMQVYEPSARAYETAIQTGQSVNGFSTSANNR